MTTGAPGQPTPDRIVGHFEPIPGSQGAFSLAVLTGRWPIAGRQLFARVGEQPLTSVIPFMGGGGFIGRLDRPPHEGDRLYVRYSGSLEVATPVVYRLLTPVASATEAKR